MKTKHYIYIPLLVLTLLACAVGRLHAQSPAYQCGFENGFGGWKNVPDQINNWVIGRGDAAHRVNERKHSETGPKEAYEGDAYAYVNFYDKPNSHPVIMTQTFDFSSLQNPIFSLYMHNYWEGDNHDLTFMVEAKESDDHFWHTPLTVTQDDGDQWHKLNACMSEFAGKSSVDIRIYIETDKGNQNIAIDNITIEDFVINAEAVDVSCFGYQDGSITISPSCGGPLYEYSIYAGANPTTTTEKSMTYTDLFANLYNARIMDISSHCVAQRPSIKVAEPAEIEVRPYITDIKCYGDKNGSIAIGASQKDDDERVFEFSKDNGESFQSDSRFSNLSGGIYNIRVRNDKKCLSKAVPVEIGKDVLLEIKDIQVTNITYCHGEKSCTISITANYGENATIDYSIDGGKTPYHSNLFQQLGAGEYSIAIIDRNKCVLKWPEPVIVTEPDKLELAEQVKHTDIDGCHGESNGTIDIKLKGGTGLYYTSIDGLIYNQQTTYTGLAAGTYNISARDQNFCSIDLGNVTITQPDPIEILDVKPHDILGCYGDATGSIDIKAQGGTGDITYKLNVEGVEPTKESTVKNLHAGRYFPSVVDEKGCEAIYEYNFVDLTQPEPFKFFNVIGLDKEIRCNGQEAGIINAVAQGGTLPYHYSIDDYEHTITEYTVNTVFFRNVGAGIYNVKARDDKGCEAQSVEIELLQPDELTITDVEVTPLMCHNDKTGSISIAADGGTPDYKYGYSIHGDNNWRDLLPRQVITNLQPDNYDIIVTDKNNCSTYKYNILVSQPEQLQITAITPHDVSICYGDKNGKIIINAIGGTQPYEYSIDNGSHYQSNNVFTDQAAGNNYHILVRDANKCEVDGGTTLIDQPAEVIINYMNYKDIHGCNGSKTGYIDFTASGGTGDLKYSITGFPQQLIGEFPNIPAGEYTLRVEDEHGCSATQNGITIHEPPVFEFADETKLTHNPCHGDNIGEAIVSIKGGMPVQTEFPYKFYLNPTTDVENTDPTCYDGIFQHLYAGQYEVIIRDAYECELSTSFSITEPELFEITGLDTLNINTCYGDSSGYIKVNITGGIQPVNFSCTSGSIDKTNTNGIFNKLTATQYGITAVDANGCKSTEYTTLTQPTQLKLQNVSFTDILCHDAGTGIIRVEADGGVGDISVSIDGGKTYPYSIGSIENVHPGNYTIMVRDHNKCVAKNTKQIKINNPPALIVEVDVQDVICHEGNTGKIVAQATGGTKPYSFSLDNENWYDSRNVFDKLTDGNYIVYVKDYNNCPTQSSPQTIKRPENRAGFKLSKTEGCSPLEITMTQDYRGLTKYTISNGDIIYDRLEPTRHTIVNNSNEVKRYEILAEIQYEDGVGCADTAYRYVTVYPQPHTDFRLVDTATVWPNNTVILANLTKNVETAHWDFGDGTTSSTINETTHEYASCGVYNIRLIQSDGRCSDTLEHVFQIEGREIKPAFTTSDNSGCEPFEVTFNNISENADSLVWDFGDGTKKVSSVKNTKHTYTAPGTYEAKLTLFGDCGSSSTTSKTITVHPKPTASFHQNLDTIYEGQILHVYCESSPSDKYIWNFGDGTIENGLATAEHEYKFDGTFDISLTVMTGNSCMDTAKVKNAVTVVVSPIIVFPTAFTPNGDGLNDRFVPVHGYIPKYEIIILNRNGVVVYRSENIDEGWDGTRNGKPCLPGMYVYKVRTILRDQTVHYQYGHVMMFR